MSNEKNNILSKWHISPEDLTEVVNSNPSLRGMILGYLAEVKLRTEWLTSSKITNVIKYDDHDRKRKGDWVITYRRREFIIEVKSLQTSTIKCDAAEGKWSGKAQCDASDQRTIKFKDGSKLETTCLLVGEFDILAINLFAFENKWRFVFAKNKDLPRSGFRKYSKEQRKNLLASLVEVTWPPSPPFKDNLFDILDELIQEREP